MKKIKVIVVDDHDLFRETLIMTINNLPNCEVVAEASNGKEFLTLLDEHYADVVFMDIKMPEMDGIKATKYASIHNQYLKIIALTMFEEKEYFIRMMEAGAKGYILKNADEEDIEKSIHTVLSGKNYYPKSVTGTIFRNNKNSNEK